MDPLTTSYPVEVTNWLKKKKKDTKKKRILKNEIKTVAVIY